MNFNTTPTIFNQRLYNYVLKSTFTFLICFSIQGINAQTTLLIPETITGTSVNLTLQNGTHEFFDGVTTNTMGANGNILGPTLILNQGDFVNFSVENQIDDITTMHWHGMHVSAENDGGPHTIINPGDTWNPSFTIMDKAGVYWYHPHLHMHTNAHVSKGIAGMIIVKDDEEAALDLPRTYGVDDFPLVLQTKDFDSENQIVVPSNSDDIAMVNATVDANLDVAAQVIRFRLLNGSSMRVFNIGLSDNMTFYQIGSDGGLLENPVPLTRLRMGPGERAEILIDFASMEGQVVELMSYASEFPNGLYGATNPGTSPSMNLDGYNPNPLNGSNYSLMQFTVTEPNGGVTEIPSSLVTLYPIPESEMDIERLLTMSPAMGGPNMLNGDFYINGASFDMDVVNYTVPLNSTEIWTIFNQSAIAHPFHIHDVQFFILDRNGQTPPPSEQGRKDVILINPMETVRFICKFEDFANNEIPYMYHCHMLIHEDGGMMGQFIVQEPDGVDENNLNDEFTIFPNPANGSIFIDFDQQNIHLNNISIYDIRGKKMKEIKTAILDNQIQIDDLPSGMYIIELQTENHRITKKIIVE